MAAESRSNDERLIICVLAGISFLCILGIIIAGLLQTPGNDALLTIGSLCVGALASRISQKVDQHLDVGTSTGVGVQDTGKASVEDDFAVIGRAATKTIIAEAMRQLGGSAPPEGTPKP